MQDMSQPDPFQNTEPDLNRDSLGNSAIIVDDHVQLLARRKALNISTTRQKDPDQPKKVNVISDSSSSYPLLSVKPQKFVRCVLLRLLSLCDIPNASRSDRAIVAFFVCCDLY